MGSELDLDAVAATSALATAQLAELRGALGDKAMRDIMIRDLAVRNGGLDLAVEGGAAGLLAEMLAKQQVDSGGVNYVELSFISKVCAPGEMFLVTVQRCAGKTPHQLRAEAEKALAETRLALALVHNVDVSDAGTAFAGQSGCAAINYKGHEHEVD